MEIETFREFYASELYQQEASLSAQVVQTTTDCFARFCLGVAAVGIITPLTSVVVSIAQRANYIPAIQEGNDFLQNLIKKGYFFAVYLCVIVPIIEEIVFRSLVQDVLLTRLLPRPETSLDTRANDIARVVITAFLFALSHKAKDGTLPASYVKLQVFSTFFLGLGLGVVKETRLGLLGAIGTHIAHNAIAIYS